MRGFNNYIADKNTERRSCVTTLNCTDLLNLSIGTDLIETFKLHFKVYTNPTK